MVSVESPCAGSQPQSPLSESGGIRRALLEILSPLAARLGRSRTLWLRSSPTLVIVIDSDIVSFFASTAWAALPAVAADLAVPLAALVALLLLLLRELLPPQVALPHCSFELTSVLPPTAGPALLPPRGPRLRALPAPAPLRPPVPPRPPDLRPLLPRPRAPLLLPPPPLPAPATVLSLFVATLPSSPVSLVSPLLLSSKVE